MPRFHVTEIRAFRNNIIIDAVDEAAAARLDGDIVEEYGDNYSWSQNLLGIERLDDEED